MTAEDKGQWEYSVSAGGSANEPTAIENNDYLVKLQMCMPSHPIFQS